jgi:hypothetical protein
MHSSYLCTYDLYLYGPVRNVFLRGQRRGMGPGNRDFFGPCEMTLQNLLEINSKLQRA